MYFKGSGPGLGSMGLPGPVPAGLAVVGLGAGSGCDLILSSETTAVPTFWRLTELSASRLLQPGLPRRPLMAVSIHVLAGGFVRSNPASETEPDPWNCGGRSWLHLLHEYNGPLIFGPQLSPQSCFCLLRSPWSPFSSSRFFCEVSLNPYVHRSSL